MESALKALTAISVAIGMLAASLVQAATPTQFHVDSDPRIVDLGLAPQGEVRTVTLSLAAKNLAEMEAYAASTADPASPNYRRFLTPAQIGARFGQDATSIAQVVNFLKAQGLTVSKVYQNNLLITARGTNAQLAAVFGSPIHTFQGAGATYEAPLGGAGVPVQLTGLVRGVHGLSSRPVVHSNAIRLPQAGFASTDAQLAPSRVPTPGTAAAAIAAPGELTPYDLAKLYNITPLYKAGITGAGKTIGIATLAGYKQSDAYTYWNTLGLAVDPHRITDVPVDGGPSPGREAGSPDAFETTLDVQQAGGVAPGANMRVYIGASTEAGFIDTLAQPIDENVVDTLSFSWGGAEAFSGADIFDALHLVFLQAAMQGIPVIVASGDSGAYEINNPRNIFRYPSCTTVLSVSYPAADPLVLAAGGITLPFTLQLPGGTISVPQERAWGGDYARDYALKNGGQAFYYQNLFPQGSGGGVSFQQPRPAYQAGLAGIANTAAGQTLLCKASVINEPGTNYLPLGTIPANVAGRNLPDVSLNADPSSGYLAYIGGWYANGGGTSFVAPQLNGIFTLIAAGRQSRLGFLQPQLYAAFKTMGYGAGSPFRPVTAGTNLFYAGKPAYNPATGLGSLDVANLAHTFGVQF